jgi:uncharacterized protein YndB with AHSA1/START domain
MLSDDDPPEPLGAIDDERLRLIFTAVTRRRHGREPVRWPVSISQTRHSSYRQEFCACSRTNGYEDEMGSIVSQVEITAAPEQVFAYVTDPTRFTEWQENVVDGGMDGGPTAVGSKCTTTRKIGGGERKATSEVTVLDPPRAWAVHGIDGPIRSTVHVTVEPVTGRNASRVTIDLDFEGHGIGKILVPLLVRPQSRKEMQRNMARLKARLEPTA